MAGSKKKKATTRELQKVAAAEAARKYRERRAAIGYVSLQVWVPSKYRAELLDIVHERLEELLALEDEDRAAVDVPRPSRRRRPA